MPPTDNVEQLPLPVEEPMAIDEVDWEDIQPDPIPSEPSQPPKARQRILPDTESARLYTAWKDHLPSLVNSLIAYMSFSTGHVVAPASDLISQCNQATCVRKDTKIQCLYFDHKKLALSPTISSPPTSSHRFQDHQHYGMSLLHNTSANSRKWTLPFSAISTSHGHITGPPQILSCTF
jgi:hypothetical protein